MGIMTFLRNHAGILLGAIGLAIFAFIIGDAITAGRPFWDASKRSVGSINGVTIDNAEFNQKVEAATNQLKQQYGNQLSGQMTTMAVENAWNQETATVLLNEEYKKLGLAVSGDELYDLIQGRNVSPLIVQYFGNPQTGQFDRNAVIQSLKARGSNKELDAQWSSLEQQIETQALQQKYGRLIQNSVYVTNLEAQDDFNAKNRGAAFKYIDMDYAGVPDNSVKITDGDYQKFYDENKEQFYNPHETRDFKFVSFAFAPSAKDSAAIKAQVDKLAQDFKTSANDSLFAMVNSDVKVPVTFIPKGSLGADVDSTVYNLPAGSFYGPVLSNGAYKMAKVLAVKTSPDSVSAAHILLNPAQYGGLPGAKKVADSLQGLVLKGADFAQLAAKYSVDGSKDKGGELGTFTRGMMVPEFENAAFDGKPGDVKVITSQFGVHVIKIEKQMGSSRVAKLAYVQKDIKPSDKTQQEAYRKASAFLNNAKGGNFEAAAKKAGVNVQLAERVGAMDGQAQGLDNTRALLRAGYDAKQGKLLDEIYTMSSAYVVAQVGNIYPKGILPLEQIKNSLTPAVRAEVKGRMLADKLAKAMAGSSSIEAVAQKVGKQVFTAENVVFANPTIPNVGVEPKVVGALFGAKPGKLNGPVAGFGGAFITVLNSINAPGVPYDAARQKQALKASLEQRLLPSAFQALLDKAEITDNRVNFY